jgi:uncharacterized protein YqjF (DUF2071 family)
MSMSTSGRPRRKAFLTARWEDLVLVNYSCPAQLLEPLVPAGTVLDCWQGDAIVSLVGFMFRNTRVMRLRVPLHETFEEVNLRFYVRRTTRSGEVRRAVVFVRELVPRAAIAFVARALYNEPYLAVPMSHESALDESSGGRVRYSWWHRGEPFAISAEASGPAEPLEPGSEAEFITEHYWGYTRQRHGGTLEYQVEHPKWLVWKAVSTNVTGSLASLHGAGFGEVLSRPPRSAFVAAGSEVMVHRGVRLAQ